MREGSNSSPADRRTTRWTEIAQLLSGEASVRRVRQNVGERGRAREERAASLRGRSIGSLSRIFKIVRGFKSSLSVFAALCAMEGD